MPKRLLPSERKTRIPTRAALVELREYFALNPEGEITIAQAAMKLDVSERSAMDYLGYLAGEGLLVRVSKYKLKDREA
jgi:Fic family protein